MEPETKIGRRRFVASAAAVAMISGCSSDEEPAAPGTSTDATTAAPTTTSLGDASLDDADVSLPPRGDGPLRVVIDTDTANEIDDQFALAWALVAPDKIAIEGITAAPFGFGDYLAGLYAVQKERGGPVTPFENVAVSLGSEQIESMKSGETPAKGMQASLAEIERVLSAAAPSAPPRVVAGSESYMKSESDPVDSAAARFIIERAHADDRPLYVPVLGAPTNVASAVVLDPSIASKIVVVFVAGFPSSSRHVDESFNLLQDLSASRVLFTKCPNFVYIPGYQVAESLSLSLPESDRYLRGTGPLGEFLAGLMTDKFLAGGRDVPGNRRVVWDLAPIAWLINPDWVPTSAAPRAQIGADHRWAPVDGLPIVEAYQVDDKAVYTDLFARLAAPPG